MYGLYTEELRRYRADSDKAQAARQVRKDKAHAKKYPLNPLPASVVLGFGVAFLPALYT